VETNELDFEIERMTDDYNQRQGAGMSARIKINYTEGSCIAVPLKNGGYSRGVIARMDKHGRVFGYFFGQPYINIPQLKDFVTLQAEDAIYIGRFGDLGLVNNEWPIIGEMENWCRSDWPLPPFIRVDTNANRAWISHYDDNNLSYIREEEVSPDRINEYPYDRFSGYVALQIHLSKLLD